MFGGASSARGREVARLEVTACHASHSSEGRVGALQPVVAGSDYPGRMVTEQNVPSALRYLRLTSGLTVLSTLVQVGLAIGLLTGSHGLREPHGIAGMVTIVASVAAAVFAFLWRRQGGSAGLLGHAMSIPVMALAQFALGEMGAELIHIIIGVLFFVAVVGLFAMAQKARPAP